jgi:hypothetical protein
VRRAILAAALLGAASLAPPAAAAPVETLRQSGPAAKRFNIAVLGDGYRNEDQTKLKTDATAIIDYLFGVSPLKQYEKFFNVKLVHVVSQENGADNGSYGATRDTALGAYFNCGGIDRLLCIDDGKAQAVAALDVPEYNFAIVLVNDPKYGGSGGSICASSSNEQSFEVLAHEVGHSLARLADEYDYEGNQPPCSQLDDCSEANVTLRTQRDQIKWKDWLEAGTPVPTPKTEPYFDVIGLFEGARYSPAGVYRPKQSCKMKDLGSEFCSVCAEQFVRSIWTADNIQMVEATQPPQKAVQSASCDPITFEVTVPPIEPSTYRFKWSVDGKPVTETKSSVKLLPAELKQGAHLVQVAIEDATELVRTDPSRLLTDQFVWDLTLEPADCAPIGGTGGTGGTGANAGAAGAPNAGSGGAGSGGGGSGGGPLAGSAGAGVGSGGAAGSGSGGLPAGEGGGAGSAASPSPPPHESSGCGCSVPGQSSGSPLSLVAGLALCFALKRRSAPPPRPPLAGSVSETDEPSPRLRRARCA